MRPMLTAQVLVEDTPARATAFLTRADIRARQHPARMGLMLR
jgi:hypothetical protein